MKKSLAIVLIVCGFIIASIFVGGFLQKRQQTDGANISTNTNQSQEAANTAMPSHSHFSVEEVAQHNSATDCWLIINSNVYNVTDFINQHPGGAERITRNCGKDATQDFETQDGHGSHSATAKSMLQSRLIGMLHH